MERGATVQFQSTARPDAADVGLDLIAVWEAGGVSIDSAFSIVLKRKRRVCGGDSDCRLRVRGEGVGETYSGP